MSIGQEELKTRFTYHAPQGDQAHRYELLREAGWKFADMVDLLCPDSREKSLAVTKIEEAVMHANASIARREPRVV
jgi:hypothetical protein